MNNTMRVYNIAVVNWKRSTIDAVSKWQVTLTRRPYARAHVQALLLLHCAVNFQSGGL